MIYIVVGFLWFAVLFYLIMGGADFGAGIIELFTRAKHKEELRKTAYIAIGPIWEANHMWLIITVVIFFVGFPDIYALVSVSLHLPILIMLIGIIARGTAFTFRNYDAVNDRMQAVYTRIYIYSSFLTPLFIGIIAATAVSGRIDPNATRFSQAYVFDWLDWYPVSVGLATVAVCGFLAAVFLVGDVGGGEDRKAYLLRAGIMNLCLIIFVLLAFRVAGNEHIPMCKWVFGNTTSRMSMGIAFVSWIGIWRKISSKSRDLTRLWAGTMVTALLVAVSFGLFPDVVLLKNGQSSSLLSDHAPTATIDALGVALLTGGCFIVPALVYLIYSFEPIAKGR